VARPAEGSGRDETGERPIDAISLEPEAPSSGADARRVRRSASSD
jgi:hypothetical protein